MVNAQCLPMTPARQKLPFRSFRNSQEVFTSQIPLVWLDWRLWTTLGVYPIFIKFPIADYLLHLTHSIQSQLSWRSWATHTHPMREACQLHCVGIYEICLWETVQLVMWETTSPTENVVPSESQLIELHVCLKAFANNQSQFDSTQPPALSPLTFGSLNVWWHCDSFNASGFCLIHWLFSTSLWVWARLIYNSPVGIMAGIMSHSQATARIRTHSLTTFEYWAYQPKHPS